jgi:hypothetical protein
MIHVRLTDGARGQRRAESYFYDAAAWASDHCESFCEWQLHDVSDVSMEYDIVVEYLFRDEKDAIMFTLRWV